MREINAIQAWLAINPDDESERKNLQLCLDGLEDVQKIFSE